MVKNHTWMIQSAQTQSQPQGPPVMTTLISAGRHAGVSSVVHVKISFVDMTLGRPLPYELFGTESNLTPSSALLGN